MKGIILKCTKCDIYTLEKKCPKCGFETKISGPIKYSTNDRFQKFRIEEIEEEENGE
jgi:H/ACA ribonucleoprotein complex subunit 3